MSTDPAAAAAAEPPMTPRTQARKKNTWPWRNPGKGTMDRKEFEAILFARHKEVCRTWIEEVTGTQFNKDKNFLHELKEGDLLCRLINILRPDTIHNVLDATNTQLAFLRRYENINSFLRGCKEVGVNESDLFNWPDLIKNESFRNVVRCIRALRAISTDPAAYEKKSICDQDKEEALRRQGLTLEDNDEDNDKPEMDNDSSRVSTGSVSPNSSLDGIDVPTDKSAYVQYLEAKCHELEATIKHVGVKAAQEEPAPAPVAADEDDAAPKENVAVVPSKLLQPVKSLVATTKKLGLEVREMVSEMNADMQRTCQAIMGATQKHSEAYSTTKQELGETQQVLSKEQALRRKLLNKVIELQGNIRVYCRVRPLSQKELREDQHNIVSFPDTNIVGLTDAKGQAKKYEFDSVFSPKSTQAEVFQDVAPFVMSCVDGYNVCVFAYGQTGSGKTHTMEGPKSDRGVNFRALDDLFRIAGEREKTHSYEIGLSCVEIYNETPRDLLLDPSQYENNPKLEIRQGKNNRVYIPNLTETPVHSREEVIDILQNKAYKNRQVGVTHMNQHSSRSHCLVFVSVNGTNLETEQRTMGKLVLIDLAGSERVKKSEAKGTRLKEAQNINFSLAALGNVISALKNKQQHIPYRNSKLTYLLQDCLGGHSKCLMFCQISPANTNHSETFCTLDFAVRARSVQLGQAKRQVRSGAGGRASKELRAVQSEMKAAKDQTDSLTQSVRQLKSSNKDKDAQIQELQDEMDRLRRDMAKKLKAAEQEKGQALAKAQRELAQQKKEAEKERKSKIAAEEALKRKKMSSGGSPPKKLKASHDSSKVPSASILRDVTAAVPQSQAFPSFSRGSMGSALKGKPLRTPRGSRRSLQDDSTKMLAGAFEKEAAAMGLSGHDFEDDINENSNSGSGNVAASKPPRSALASKRTANGTPRGKSRGTPVRSRYASPSARRTSRTPFSPTPSSSKGGDDEDRGSKKRVRFGAVQSRTIVQPSGASRSSGATPNPRRVRTRAPRGLGAAKRRVTSNAPKPSQKRGWASRW